MPTLLRPANLFVLWSYLVLSAASFAPVLFGRTVEQPWRVLGMEVFAWLTVWTLFKRPARFHWLLLPAFFALPLEAWLQMYYKQGISAHHLGIIAETSPREALEFLGSRLWLLLALAIGIFAWWWSGLRAARRTRDLDWTGTTRWATLAVLLALCIWSYARDHDPRKPSASAWDTVSFDMKTFGETWPFGLAVRFHAFYKERMYLAELARKSRQFKFGASQAGDIDVAQVVVMVIGESARYDRWSINGYQRDTNPLLKKEANLVSLSDVTTAVSATRLSVPVLVSRKPATQSLQAGFSEKSFLSAFKEAGFKTFWLSNQMSFGQFDTPISVFANEADVTQFLNLGGFAGNSSFDGILLGPLKAALNDHASKKLIVLHTLGSHWNYSHRYPQEYDRWQPSLFGIERPAHTDIAIKAQLNNSYDNSILYTDWFLSQVIDILKSSRQMSLMMYVSDHGQVLYDGSCKLAFHGHNTQYDFHVPALVWYSDLYRAAHPVKVTQLLKNRQAKLSTENIFHSLLDMADIRYSGEQLEWSFASPKFRQHKRYVDSHGWADYDNAGFKGDCREVIDRGTPLAQLR